MNIRILFYYLIQSVICIFDLSFHKKISPVRRSVYVFCEVSIMVTINWTKIASFDSSFAYYNLVFSTFSFNTNRFPVNFTLDSWTAKRDIYYKNFPRVWEVATPFSILHALHNFPMHEETYQISSNQCV